MFGKQNQNKKNSKLNHVHDKEHVQSLKLIFSKEQDHKAEP